jgi:hypothetical protein
MKQQMERIDYETAIIIITKNEVRSPKPHIMATQISRLENISNQYKVCFKKPVGFLKVSTSLQIR